jgi:hypothetical protein
MKKLGAWLMLTIATLFALVGTLLTLNAILRALSFFGGSDVSAYEMGALTGQIVGLLLLFAIAWKLFTKGRAMLKVENPRANVKGAI